MYCAFPCIKGAYGKACCTWTISVCPLDTDLCSWGVLASVTRVGPTSVETDWWPITSGLVACGAKPEPLDGYGGGATKYSGCEVPSAYGEMASPSSPTSPLFCRCFLSHHRKMRNPTSIPVVAPPNAPPTIIPVLGEPLLLSVLAVELDCVKEPLAMLVGPGTTREMIGPILMGAVIPVTAV